jgi:hypothetical protein
VAIAPLDGVPGPLLLAPGPGGRGHRLYATEALPGPDGAGPGEPPEACAEANYGEAFEGARAWRVWDLDAATLAPEAEHVVPYPPRALAATPDGGFTLDVFGDRVWSLDRTRGRGLRTIPTGRSPLGLALAAAGRP